MLPSRSRKEGNMATTKRTISVRLDDRTKQQVEKAAKLLKQSKGAFLGKAGEKRAQEVLLEWAIDRHRKGESSLSQLAEETGLAVEEIMDAMGQRSKEEALEMFLMSARAAAAVQPSQGGDEFLRMAEEVAKEVFGPLPRPEEEQTKTGLGS
jgi:predicted transcriptional regulator